MRWKLSFVTLTTFGFMTPAAATAEDGDDQELDEISVTASRVANTRPAGTYSSIATVLRFDPLTELQSRGLPEGQADVTVRGGLFENTGFKVGSVTIIDPQTGHYAAGLPIAPELLQVPDLLTGIDNSLAGFNSTIATVAHSLRKISDGGTVLVGVGSDALQFQSVQLANTSSVGAGTRWGTALSLSRSQGDGTVPDGDHEFERYNIHVQRSAGGQQSDLILAHQDKFYGWPGAYTGFASLAETDHTEAAVILLNHRSEIERGWWELGAFYRGLVDDYDFDRTTQESGAPGAFDHETRVTGIGVQGLRRGNALDWHYAAQLTADELVSSTDLTEGDYNSRNYAAARIVPSIDIERADNRVLTLRFGASVDWSNRDSSKVSPLLGATLRVTSGAGSHYYSAEYAGTSQLPGYTVLKSRPTGLFGGNASLGREIARQLSISAGRETAEWDGSLTLFFRQDDNLVDWTFESGAPFSRQANPVDIDVTGFEAFLRRQWESIDIVGSYTYLDKDADYGSAVVDASFYALNFATHRATLAARFRFNNGLELRWDNEYREQRRNPLRGSSDEAFLVSLALAWDPPGSDGFNMAVTADNLTDDDYEQFPGTPAVGRQVSLSVRYAW